jgi:signal transduction histidine kinase
LQRFGLDRAAAEPGIPVACRRSMDTTRTTADLIDRARLEARLELALGLRDALLNPLAALLGALRVLQTSALPPERAQRLVAEAERQARRITDIVQNVGASSRAPVVEVGRLQVADVARACTNALG